MRDDHWHEEIPREIYTTTTTPHDITTEDNSNTTSEENDMDRALTFSVSRFWVWAGVAVAATVFLLFFVTRALSSCYRTQRNTSTKKDLHDSACIDSLNEQ